MPARIRIQPDTTNLRLGIAVSKYHAWATEKLLRGAQERFQRLRDNCPEGQISNDESALLIVPAAGAWELTAICRAMCQNNTLDGIVALGVVIQGETSHFEYLCQGITQGLTNLTTKFGIPIGFGVLTCQNTAQVEARCGGAVGNKGAEALQAVVESIHAIRSIAEWPRAENPPPGGTGGAGGTGG